MVWLIQAVATRRFIAPPPAVIRVARGVRSCYVSPLTFNVNVNVNVTSRPPTRNLPVTSMFFSRFLRVKTSPHVNWSAISV